MREIDKSVIRRRLVTESHDENQRRERDFREYGRSALCADRHLRPTPAGRASLSRVRAATRRMPSGRPVAVAFQTNRRRPSLILLILGGLALRNIATICFAIRLRRKERESVSCLAFDVESSTVCQVTAQSTKCRAYRAHRPLQSPHSVYAPAPRGSSTIEGARAPATLCAISSFVTGRNRGE